MEYLVQRLNRVVQDGSGLTIELAEEFRQQLVKYALVLVVMLVVLALINIYWDPFPVFCLQFLAIFMVASNSLRPRWIAIWAGLNAVFAGLQLNNPARAIWDSILVGYPKLIKATMFAVVFICIFLGTFDFEGNGKRLVYIVGFAIGIWIYVWHYEIPDNWLKKISGTYLVLGMIYHFWALLPWSDFASDLGLEADSEVQNFNMSDYTHGQILTVTMSPTDQIRIQAPEGIWLCARTRDNILAPSQDWKIVDGYGTYFPTYALSEGNQYKAKLEKVKSLEAEFSPQTSTGNADPCETWMKEVL